MRTYVNKQIMAELESITPIVEYRDSPRDPTNYVVVRLDIDGLKKKRFGNDPANANITFDISGWSFKLMVELVSSKEAKVSRIYTFEIKRLPAEILTDRSKTFYKVKKDEVELHLCKKVPGMWMTWLSSVGLEQEQS